MAYIDRRLGTSQALADVWRKMTSSGELTLAGVGRFKYNPNVSGANRGLEEFPEHMIYKGGNIPQQDNEKPVSKPMVVPKTEPKKIVVEEPVTLRLSSARLNRFDRIKAVYEKVGGKPIPKEDWKSATGMGTKESGYQYLHSMEKEGWVHKDKEGTFHWRKDAQGNPLKIPYSLETVQPVAKDSPVPPVTPPPVIQTDSTSSPVDRLKELLKQQKALLEAQEKLSFEILQLQNENRVTLLGQIKPLIEKLDEQGLQELCNFLDHKIEPFISKTKDSSNIISLQTPPG